MIVLSQHMFHIGPCITQIIFRVLLSVSLLICSSLSRLVGSNNVVSSSVQASQTNVQKETAALKIEMGTWNSVKSRQATFTDKIFVNARQRGTSLTELVILSALFILRYLPTYWFYFYNVSGMDFCKHN